MLEGVCLYAIITASDQRKNCWW